MRIPNFPASPVEDKQIDAELEKFDMAVLKSAEFENNDERIGLSYRIETPSLRAAHQYRILKQSGQCAEVFACDGSKAMAGFTLDVGQKEIYSPKSPTECRPMTSEDKKNILKAIAESTQVAKIANINYYEIDNVK